MNFGEFILLKFCLLAVSSSNSIKISELSLGIWVANGKSLEKKLLKVSYNFDLTSHPYE